MSIEKNYDNKVTTGILEEDTDLKSKKEDEASKKELKTRPDFDPESLVLPKNYSNSLSVEQVHTTISVSKPDSQWFCRVHPDFEFRSMLLLFREDSNLYVVEKELWSDLTSELNPFLVVLAVNRQGKEFLWPLRLPADDGRPNPWHVSALAAAELGKSRWVRMSADRNEYKVEIARSNEALPDPCWTGRSMKELIKLGFRGRYVDTLEHPVVRKLRGEI